MFQSLFYHLAYFRVNKLVFFMSFQRKDVQQAHFQLVGFQSKFWNMKGSQIYKLLYFKFCPLCYFDSILVMKKKNFHGIWILSSNLHDELDLVLASELTLRDNPQLIMLTFLLPYSHLKAQTCTLTHLSKSWLLHEVVILKKIIQTLMIFTDSSSLWSLESIEKKYFRWDWWF